MLTKVLAESDRLALDLAPGIDTQNWRTGHSLELLPLGGMMFTVTPDEEATVPWHSCTISASPHTQNPSLMHTLGLASGHRLVTRNWKVADDKASSTHTIAFQICARTSDWSNKSHSKFYLQCSTAKIGSSFPDSAGQDAKRANSWYSLKAYETMHVECLALSLADSKCPFSFQCPESFKAIAQWGRICATSEIPRPWTHGAHSLMQALISPKPDRFFENRHEILI